jgi:Mor family transcriptional regulator
MPRFTKATLIKLQKSLRQDAAIGAKYGITRQAVHQWRKMYGIASVIKENPKRDREIVKAYKGGTAVSAIAKKCKLSVSYTYRIIGGQKGTKKRKKK